jgi:HAD superfamily hydrolase (TIGR01490 family)
VADTDPLARFKKAGAASADAALGPAAPKPPLAPAFTAPDVPPGEDEPEIPAGVDAVVDAVVSSVEVQGPDDPLSDVPPNPQVAAFFDIDNTIMRGASSFYLAKGAYQRRFLSMRDLAGFAVDQLKFATAGGEDLDVMAKAMEAGLSFVNGRTIAEMEQLGEEIYEQGIRGKVWPGTLTLAQQHLARGERVWLVSATPVEVARVIADRLGLTGAMGTVAQVRDGVYTGRLVGTPLHGVAKAEALRALAAREGLDLSRCYAYSDSSNDMPMLTAVGRAVAVNPDDELRQAAVDNRWPIYDYRGRRNTRVFILPAAIGGAAIVGAAIGAAGTLLMQRLRRTS